MTWEVFSRAVSVALEQRITSLNFFGGEPLLNPQFFPMFETALEQKFNLILTTNCRPLAREGIFQRFIKTTSEFKDRIVIVTARDRFHLQHFDPAAVIEQLRREGYSVTVNDYSNHTLLISEHNSANQDLRALDTGFSCCNADWKDYIGVLPDGGWTICPASLEAFGNIFTHHLDEIVQFKLRLPLRYKEGCTRCLKDFKSFRREFDRNLSTTSHQLGEQERLREGFSSTV
jgi:MoaA/NifB/PqqE/SkfB family radical SAM enzyme